jgi:alpha-amylase/alpha-mannosidase (GH57 family)
MSQGTRPRVELLLLWHMHQPGYGSPRDGRPVLPWTRLHATKDYLDMVETVLERPGLAVTFNLVPSLLEQLAAAAAGVGDPELDLARADPSSLGETARNTLQARFTIAPPWARHRFPGLERLHRRGAPGAGGAPPLTDGEVLDLVVLHALAWIDPRFHRRPALAPLAARAAAEASPGFDGDDRDTVLAEARALLGGVLARYRALVTRSTRSEISVSPAYHPILPLLCDTESARVAMPQVPLPATRFVHPEDASAHLRAARRVAANAFGHAPVGLWPSEGSVSPEVAHRAAEAGFRWMASDAEVLARSHPAGGGSFGPWAHARPWRMADGTGPWMFFRDRELSDRIGFTYATWSAADAVADFVARLGHLRETWPGPGPARLLVALDGENCWEWYPDDGNEFLARLYDTLLATPWIHTRTPGEVLGDPDLETTGGRLDRLHTGSWIEANFRIWIGHPEKNRAWEAVARVRSLLAEAFPEDAGGPPDVAFWDGQEPVWGEDLGGRPAPLPPEAGGPPETPEARAERRRQAWRHLLVAEGSDWCWWYGDDHFTADKATFDRILREHLSRACELAGCAVPVELRSAFGIARVTEERKAPTSLISPGVSGRLAHFYEWDGAGRWIPAGAGGSMHAGRRVRAIFHGFDEERIYVRADLDAAAPDTTVTLEFVEPAGFRIEVARGDDAPVRSTRPDGGSVEGAAAAWDGVCEFGVPFRSLGVAPGARVAWVVAVREGGHVVATAPPDTPLSIEAPGPDVRAGYWSA